ncbi:MULTISPECIES: IclR family transcriptional regulator [Streptomyces]|uniref:IclR family transcriptional regulator n=1 Tax=Streptomyces lasiicapitis TaxID=1923961 RepID=A0ABQ2MFC4_9ACTN|nr:MULTISPECIES: IclR family transcriptional regulator [Streptomyces]GGO50780.1 IclR family transcriptional regulator [Streptomyces lasiicapitis]
MTRTRKEPGQNEEPHQETPSEQRGEAHPQQPGKPREAQAKAPAGSVQSVDRAVSVLEILARHGEAGVTEIADELGVHKSTAFRLLGVLENRGLVGQAKDRGKYFLGAGVLRLAGAAAVRMDISQEGGPVCRDLADELGETVNIAVIDDDAAVNIMQARGPASVTAQNWLGRRTPLHATSSGKVLLAHLPTTLREGLIARTLPRITEQTVTGTVALRRDLETVVQQGFAIAVEELEVGLAAVAAPVRAHDGKVIGALSASGPVYRLTEDRLTELAKRTVAAAVELSRRMGYGF